MDHRCCFSGSPGTTGLRPEDPDEADADDGAPEADHPVTINIRAALIPVIGHKTRLALSLEPSAAVNTAACSALSAQLGLPGWPFGVSTSAATLCAT